MQASIKEFEERNIGLVAISVDPMDVSTRMRERHGLTFPLLSDVNAEVIRAYDVFNPLARISKPATFVLDGDGIIRWRKIGEHLADRPLAATVLEKATALLPDAVPDPAPMDVSARGKSARTWADIKQGEASE